MRGTFILYLIVKELIASPCPCVRDDKGDDEGGVPIFTNMSVCKRNGFEKILESPFLLTLLEVLCVIGEKRLKWPEVCQRVLGKCLQNGAKRR